MQVQISLSIMAESCCVLNAAISKKQYDIAYVRNLFLFIYFTL